MIGQICDSSVVENKAMASKAAFKVGDLVQLKSEGPVMTVEKLFDGSCRCQWFGGRKLEGGIFPFDSLVAAPQEDAKK